MSLHEEEESSAIVETARFEPIDGEEGKIVIDMRYIVEGNESQEKSEKFSLELQRLDPTRLTMESGKVVDCLEKLGVHETVWDGAIDDTLIALEEILVEMGPARDDHVDVGPTRCGPLGLQVSIRVSADMIMDDDNDDDDDYLEPEYYMEDEEDQEPAEYGNDDVAFVEEKYDEVAVKQVLVTSGVNFDKLAPIGDNNSGCCAICLEEFNRDGNGVATTSEVAVLSCNHVLHEKCLIPWVVKGGEKTTCPLCRSPICFPYCWMI